MARREQQSVSRFTLTVAREIILLRANSVAISVEMETTLVENVMLAGRKNLKKRTLDFIICFRCAITILQWRDLLSYLVCSSSVW